MKAGSARVVGAYAAVAKYWNHSEHDDFLRAVLDLPGCTGLEIPFTGVFSPAEADRLRTQITAQQRHVMTLIPGTMMLQTQHSGAGLAAADLAGRDHALRFHRAARDAVATLADMAGADVVVAVEINSAPLRGEDSGDTGARFAEMLHFVADWDWCGATLVIEHCDAWSRKFPPQKGFLELEAEIAAVQAVQVDRPRTPVGISLNWARSAIEARDVSAPLEHARLAADAGVLNGFILSGCSDQPSPYGAGWADGHLPPAGVHLNGADDPHSLLTAELAAQFGAAAESESLLFDGVKVCVFPADAPPATRLDVITQTLGLLPQLATSGQRVRGGERVV